MNHKRLNSLLALVLAVALSGCGGQTASASAGSALPTDRSIAFTDDDGREIALAKPCSRIISLYSAHTENLYELGAGDRIIGVHETSVYPPEAAFQEQYDYDADPERVIAAEPDLVLIRPFITKKAPDFVKALESAGLTVVSLYPETLDAFDGYIEKLGLLVGAEERAAEKLLEFHENIDEVHKQVQNAESVQRIFFEATEVNLRTVTEDSMAGQAIVLAGGENVAAGAEAVSPGSSIASFGEEKILALADSIDVYVSQRGAMNAGGNLRSIVTRPGFDTIKAVREGRVFVMNEKLISSPTFRYYKGVRELARVLFPALMDSLEADRTDAPAVKQDLAEVLVKAAHLPLYVTSSSKYYREEHKGHTYGLFADVTWEQPQFDAIETAVMGGYIDYETVGAEQYFHAEMPVTREMLAKTLFILGDFEPQEQKTPISDLADCKNANQVQLLVDSGVLTLNAGSFEPARQVTKAELVEAFSKMPPRAEG